MVKGITRQVILVQSPDRALFDQAIFILKEEAVQEGITDSQLLKEAQRAIQGPEPPRKRHYYLYGAFWAGLGAAATGLIWLATVLI